MEGASIPRLHSGHREFQRKESRRLTEDSPKHKLRSAFLIRPVVTASGILERHPVLGASSHRDNS
jgi:hypothetical protein